MQLVGWVSCLFLSVCGLPQAYKSYKDGHSNGISWLFILAWLVGEFLGLIYVTWLGELPLIFNTGVNVLFCAIILYYKIWKRDDYG